MSDGPKIRYADPVDAVERTAAAHGIHLYTHVAAAIADAVLNTTADTVVSMREACAREQWEHDERYRDHVRAHLRRKLLDAVTSQGRIPTTLPVEELRHYDWRNWPMSRMTDEQTPDGAVVPDWAIEQGADWTHVEVSLTVPVRTPPIDRAAAVKAGLV